MPHNKRGAGGNGVSVLLLLLTFGLHTLPRRCCRRRRRPQRREIVYYYYNGGIDSVCACVCVCSSLRRGEDDLPFTYSSFLVAFGYQQQTLSLSRTLTSSPSFLFFYSFSISLFRLFYLSAAAAAAARDNNPFAFIVFFFLLHSCTHLNHPARTKDKEKERERGRYLRASVYKYREMPSTTSIARDVKERRREKGLLNHHHLSTC